MDIVLRVVKPFLWTKFDVMSWFLGTQSLINIALLPVYGGDSDLSRSKTWSSVARDSGLNGSQSGKIGSGISG